MKKNVKRFVCIMCIMALSTAVCYGAEWVHSEAPYDGYQTDTIVLTGEGLNKEVSFTVAELEAMTEQAVTAMYTMCADHGVETNQYQGIPLSHLLQLGEPNEKAKFVKVISEDGHSATFTFDELAKKTYVNELGDTGLVAIVAYGKNGFPMVREDKGPGYNVAIHNSGGPLRLVIGQAEPGDINAKKFAKSIVKIEVMESGERTDFGDLGPDYHWAKESIYKLVDKGIVNGVSKNSFAPEQKVKRSEYSKMITLGMGLEPAAVTQSTFQDVTAGYWGAPYIEAAAKHSLMKGTSGNRFNPEGYITRNEIAVLVVRAMGLESEAQGMDKNSLSYGDKDLIPEWAVGSVAVASAHGLFTNIAGATFDGDKAVTRAEAAVITQRMLDNLHRPLKKA